MAKKNKTSRPARSAPKRAKAARRAPARRAGRAAPAKKAARARKPSAVPAGMHTVTPNLVLSSCADAIAFYKEAFGARELMRMTMPGTDRVMHAEMRIGDSVVFMNDAMGNEAVPSTESPSTTSIWLYVQDCDEVFSRAVNAGATAAMPVADMFWGDRVGLLLDPFGIRWSVATHVKDVSTEEAKKAGEEFARKMAGKANGGAPAPQPGAGPGVPSAGEPQGP